jgi:hypothetical protein
MGPAIQRNSGPAFLDRKRPNCYGTCHWGGGDEGSNQSGLFQEPRDWAYWHCLPNRKPYQKPSP